MKTKILLFVLLFVLLVVNLFSSVTSLNVQPVVVNNMYLEAQSYNNPVLHIGVTADSTGGTLTSISVLNTLNSQGYGSAVSPTSISTIKLWYVPSDSANFNAASAQYVTFLAASFDNSTSSYDIFSDNTFSLAVANGSGIWVTVDIPPFPVFSTLQMQTNGLIFTGSSITSSDEPASPPAFLLTQYTPATNLAVSNTSGNIQQYVSTGQNNIIATVLHLYNNSGSTSSPITLNNLTITAQNTLGAPIAPSSILSDIKIQDNDTGTIYSELNSTDRPLPSTASPMLFSLSGLSIPAGSTINANVIITITGLTNTAGTSFSLAINNSSYFNAADANTNNPVGVSLSSSPILSNPATIQKAAQLIDAGCANIIPVTINKGQTGIKLLDIVFSNPGDSLTASAQVYNVNLYFEDNNNNPVIPGSLFSNISVTDPTGSIIYGFQTAPAIAQTGNTVSMALPNMLIVPPVSSEQSITVAVQANILTSTAINNFKIGVQSHADISARDNNFLTQPVAVSLTPSPFYSSLALLSSSFTVSHTAAMPKNIYKGENNVHAIDFFMSPPLVYGTGSGNVLVSAMTLTAVDSSGNLLSASDYISSISMVSISQTAAVSSIPASPSIYIAFPSPVTIPASGYTMSYYININSNVSGSDLQLSLASASNISSYQDNEPSRQIYISAAAPDSFPMSSGTGYISGNTSSLSFANYPNPFKAGSLTNLTYYLSGDAKVTLKIFDIAGSFIATILDNSSKPVGSHDEDTWNGNDSKGHEVLAGTYIAQIQVTINGKKNTSLRKITFIK